MPSAEDCSTQQIVKDKDDQASIPISSTKTNVQIIDCKQQKRQQFDLFKKTARSKVSYENYIINYPSPNKTEFPAGNWIVGGDSSITGIDEKRFSKNCLVKVHDFRSATLADINHHIIPILQKKPDVLKQMILSLEKSVRSFMICSNLGVASLLRPYQTAR